MNGEIRPLAVSWQSSLTKTDLCLLTIELSGARADVGYWHFIVPASARTRC
jgi:hypothetical protein